MVLAALFAFAAPAHAFTIRGRVVNGTTGAAVSEAKVVVVNPAGGMLTEREIQARGGRFEVAGLDAQAPIYLLRVDYDGVPYNVPVRVDGADHEVVVHVYESSASWEGVRVSVPHVAASRHGRHLTIEQVFDLSNESKPPRTVAGEHAYFRLFIPEDMDSLTACFVTSMGVPVDRTPVPTGEPGVYRVEYPIRPGLTRVGIAYKVPYESGRYQLNAKVLYDLAHVSIFAVDTGMEVTCSSHELQPGEPVHGMAAYSLHGVSKGSVLSLAFAGGTGAGLAAGREVMVVPNDSQRLALYSMIALLLVLVAVVGATARHADPSADVGVMRAHYDLLVKRLARLDDLRAADAVSPDAHRAARDDMTARLAALAMKLRAAESAGDAAAPPSGARETARGPAPATRETA